MTSQEAHPKNEQQLEETHIEVVRPNDTTPPSDTPLRRRLAPPSTSKHPRGLERQVILSQYYRCGHEEIQAATNHPRMATAAPQTKYQWDHHLKVPRGK